MPKNREFLPGDIYRGKSSGNLYRIIGDCVPDMEDFIRVQFVGAWYDEFDCLKRLIEFVERPFEAIPEPKTPKSTIRLIRR